MIASFFLPGIFQPLGALLVGACMAMVAFQLRPWKDGALVHTAFWIMLLAAAAYALNGFCELCASFDLASMFYRIRDFAGDELSPAILLTFCVGFAIRQFR